MNIDVKICYSLTAVVNLRHLISTLKSGYTKTAATVAAITTTTTTNETLKIF